MYKDFKKTESLDTGFVGGSGIVWMFSGIIIGLLVGLGMYYFSNMNAIDTATAAGVVQQSSEQKIIKKEQFNKPLPLETVSTFDKPSEKQADQKESKHGDFSYYAVLPTLNVPVGSVKALDTRASVNLDKPEKAKSNVIEKPETKGKNKAALKPANGKYILQIASFKRKSSARIALKALTKRGIKAQIQKKKIKGRLWYRIATGPLDGASAKGWKKKAEKLGHKPRIFQPKS